MIFSFVYSLIRWLIIAVIFILLLLLFFIEHPAVILTLVQKPLKEIGVNYGEVKGSLLSGFEIHDVNYQNNIQADKIGLKVDFEKLEDRVLHVENLELDGLTIDKTYLSSLIDTNSTKEEDKTENSLPFDKVIIDSANIRMKNINYKDYSIKSVKLEVKNLKSDLKQQYIGDIYLLLDSNITNIDLNASINNKNVILSSTIEPKVNFLHTFSKDYNLTFVFSPLFTLKAKGHIENKIEYELKTKRLGLIQNKHQIDSQKLLLLGSYNIATKDVFNHIDTDLYGTMAELSLVADTTLNIDDINNSLEYKADLNTTIESLFLNNLLAEQNVSFSSSPKFSLKSAGNLEYLTYDLTGDKLNINQNKYEIRDATIKTKGDYSFLNRDVTTTINAKLDSNIANSIDLNLDAKFNISDLNTTLKYKADLTTTIKKEFLNETLAEHNLTFLASSNIELQSAGDFESLTYKLRANGLNLKYNEYSLNSGDFLTHGDYSILHKDVTTVIDTTLSTNVADPIKLYLDAKFNTDDINSSLEYKLKAHILPKKEFIQSKIPDNLNIKEVAPIDIIASGSLEKTIFEVSLNQLKAQREDIEAEIKTLSLKGESNILQGDTTVDISTSFDSTVGKGHIEEHVTLNFNDVENSLKYKAKIEIDASSTYLNKMLKEQEVEVQGSPKIKLDLDGDMRQITLQLDSQADIIKDKKLSKIDIKSSPILLNLKEHTIEGKLKIINDSDNLGFVIESSFSGDYTNPKGLKIKNDIDIKNFNAFGINLDSLAPIDIKMDNGENGTTFTINSKRIKLKATTTDQDHFVFDIKTDKLYLYKMITLPEALDHKFVKLDIKGEVTISTQQFKLHGDLYSNKKFHAKIDAKNDNSGLEATLKTKHLLLIAKGDIKSKKIDVKLKTDSLNKLQNELHALYEFQKIAIDGEIEIIAKLNGEDIHANINSQELLFDGFNVEKLEIDALYSQSRELLTLNRVNFNTRRFEDKSLNRKFYLNKKGLVHLGKKRDVLLDMHPNILIELRGDEEYLEGDFKITKLPLGHPNYGSMVLTTDVHYLQEGKRKSITGDIFLKKMKLFYEAKFLDVDHDSDVIIITKQDKANKEKSEDNFLENTSIALNIHAPEGNYRTPDIDLMFDIKVEANKEFGKELALFGKVEEINGRVDQVPKRFQIVHSNIVFKGGKKINPLLDIHVEYELPQVMININIGGSAERPKIEFSSEPPMPKKDIMSYLLLGVSTANFANGEGSVSREVELFIINQAARDLSYELEFDRVFVKDDGTGEGYAIEVGKKVSPKNMIILESSKEGNSLILEHDVSKNIKLRVGHHQKDNPSQSIDIFFRKRFK